VVVGFTVAAPVQKKSLEKKQRVFVLAVATCREELKKWMLHAMQRPALPFRPQKQRLLGING
jgi:hypothetical protein